MNGLLANIKYIDVPVKTMLLLFLLHLIVLVKYIVIQGQKTDSACTESGRFYVRAFRNQNFMVTWFTNLRNLNRKE